MTASCPACGTADHTVLVSAAVLDPQSALDASVREQLDVPREPKLLSPASAVLFTLAGLQILPLLIFLIGLGSDDHRVVLGSLAICVLVLLLAGVFGATGRAVLVAARRRRLAEGGWPVRYEQWQLVHGVWRAAWLCRGCAVAFFPQGSLRPDFPASPPLRLEHFQDWLTETAKQTEYAGGMTAATA
ncbi:hypothetical protein [Streptomyces sp. TLI_171]|uniref:hypothetical protein n=1 Tax=Streptomyces sp. TLI_171 TaxID=1938859 RepID=UPI000C177F3D|nr:hypothetical protein [Streptomyces sp. TLI_171]RKE23309.1 hypothetical protein BX266_6773 [Streptomyces sp. TLI_171]